MSDVQDASLSPPSNLYCIFAKAHDSVLGTLTLDNLNVNGNIESSVRPLTCVLSAAEDLTGVLAIDDAYIDATVEPLGAPEHYDGSYTVRSVAGEDVILDTMGKFMDEDMTVERIEYSETYNGSGFTVYIG